MTKSLETLQWNLDDRGVATVTLQRPDVRNAFNDQLIEELTRVFTMISAEPSTRVALLRASGRVFCAGADLNWMRKSAQLSLEDNRVGAAKMSRMFRAVAACEVPVIAVVHGHAIGGGAGLVAAADVAIGIPDAKIGFTEVRLGIVPAVISPFVLRKIGRTHAARYFATGEVFDGREAERMGLLQKCVPQHELDEEVDGIVASILASGPLAVRESKRLIDLVENVPVRDCDQVTVPLIARLRVSDEGQEGMSAFLEKRRPSWYGEGESSHA